MSLDSSQLNGGRAGLLGFGAETGSAFLIVFLCFIVAFLWGLEEIVVPGAYFLTGLGEGLP